MAVASDPIENDAWPSLVNTPPIDCGRGCLGTSHVKGLNARGYYEAQYPPEFSGRRALSHTVTIVVGDSLSIVTYVDNGGAEYTIYQYII